MLNSLRLFWNAITFVFGYSKISTAKGGKTVVVNVTIIKPETNVNVWHTCYLKLSCGSRNGYLTQGACPLLARPFFLVPTTSKRLLRRLGKRTIGVLSSKQPIHDPRLVPVLKASVLDRES